MDAPWVKHYQPGVPAQIELPTESLVALYERSVAEAGPAIGMPIIAWLLAEYGWRMSFVGTSLIGVVAIAALWWTWHTRLIYSITRQLRAREFVEAAETLGASKFHILFREILPNCVSAIAVKTSLDCGFVILVGASLSFLGLGIQPPTPDLGTMVASGSAFLPDYWWESVLPGCAILDAICAAWPVGVLRVADRGVREGILLNLFGAAPPIHNAA